MTQWSMPLMPIARSLRSSVVCRVSPRPYHDDHDAVMPPPSPGGGGAGACRDVELDFPPWHPSSIRVAVAERALQFCGERPDLSMEVSTPSRAKVPRPERGFPT